MLTVGQQAWVDALRSGDYQQTNGTLRRKEAFCVLGVACDVSGVGEWAEPARDSYGQPFYRYVTKSGQNAGPLPLEVHDFLGLDREAHRILINSVMHLNDSRRRNFNQLADIIEECLNDTESASLGYRSKDPQMPTEQDGDSKR